MPSDRPRRVTQKLCVVMLLALAACACERMPKTPSAVDPAAIEAYHKADQALLERARRGVRSTLTFVDLDGTTHEGVNEIISGTPHRMREVRPDYEAVGVGDVICTQTQDSNVPVCEEGEFEPGLRMLDDSAIVLASSTVAKCGRATCRRIRIEQTSTPWADVEKVLKRKQASADEVRLVVSLLVTDDGLPYSQAEWRWSGGKHVEGQATYLFDYDTPVSPIELPPESKSLVSPKGE